MPRGVFLALAPALLAAAACGPRAGHKEFSGPYHLERGPSRRVRCSLACRCGSPGLRLKAWRIFAMKAPELPSQSAVYSALSSRGAGQRAVLTHETLAPLSLVQGKGGEPVKPLRGKELADALSQSRTIAFRAPAFQSWMAREKLLREPGERDLTFAFRVHDRIARTFKPGSSGDYGNGCVVTNVVRAGESGCGGFSVLFVSVMRANRIPARARFGRWINGEVHVKADFWAEGVGWVNAETAAAVRDWKRDPAAIERTFGHEEGIFLTFHTDADMLIPDLDGRERNVPFMQFGGAWWQGEGVEQRWSSEETWRLEELGT